MQGCSTEQKGGANKLCTIIAQLKKERTAAKDHNGGTIKILTVKQTGQENGRETGQKKRRETRKHNKDPKRTEGKTGEEGKYTPSVSPSIKKQTNIYSRMLASKGNATKEVSGAMEFENPVQLYSSSSLRKNQHAVHAVHRNGYPYLDPGGRLSVSPTASAAQALQGRQRQGHSPRNPHPESRRPRCRRPRGRSPKDRRQKDRRQRGRYPQGRRPQGRRPKGRQRCFHFHRRTSTGAECERTCPIG